MLVGMAQKRDLMVAQYLLVVLSEGSELGLAGSEVDCGAVSEGSLVGSQTEGSEVDWMVLECIRII